MVRETARNAEEHEVTQGGSLLDGKGRLREPGWARSLILEYDRKAIRAPRLRIKEWDYYCVVSEKVALAFTIADNSYMGLLSASAIDLEAGGELTESVMTALPMGRTSLPSDSRGGVSAAEAKGLKLSFVAEGDVRRLKVACPRFGSASKGAGMGFEADLILRERKGSDSMAIATPFKGYPKAFYYNQKINCMGVEGRARIGGRELSFAPGEAFAVLDWGRGVWPYSNSWLWGSASGLGAVEGSGEKLSFGFNIGYGFGDTSAASENIVFADGKGSKLGKVEISFDEKDYLKPWKAVSEDGRLDMRLTPILDRASTSDFLVLASIQHQVFGRWSGRARLDDGRVVEFRDLMGFCEKVRNRW
jgi:hypothetical protein